MGERESERERFLARKKIICKMSVWVEGGGWREKERESRGEIWMGGWMDGQTERHT